MNKTLNYVLITFCVFISCAFCGCNQQNGNNPNITTKETTILSSYTHSTDDIMDYKIQYDEDKSLKISVTTATKLNEIENTLNSLFYTSSIQPMISDVEAITHIEEFRNICVENEEQYYCVLSDENDNKLYLFFDEFGSNRWRCYTYYKYSSKKMYKDNYYEYLEEYINSLDR